MVVGKLQIFVVKFYRQFIEGRFVTRLVSLDICGPTLAFLQSQKAVTNFCRVTSLGKRLTSIVDSMLQVLVLPYFAVLDGTISISCRSHAVLFLRLLPSDITREEVIQQQASWHW